MNTVFSEPYSLDQLSSPIAEDNPAGIDIRDDISPSSMYYVVKDARNAARAIEKKSTDTNYYEIEEWKPVSKNAPKILTELSKDLEIAAWHIEALCRDKYNGFKALSFGFDAAAKLINESWDLLYPLPDEDGEATRIAPISGLNGYGREGTLIMPIKSIVILRSSDGETINGWQCQQAGELDRIEDDSKRENRVQAGWLTSDMISDVVRQCDIDQIKNAVAEINLAIESFANLEAAINERCPSEPTSNIRNALAEVLASFLHQLKHAGIDLNPAPAITDTTEGDSDAPAAQAQSATNTEFKMSDAGDYLTQKKQALATLNNVADFFLKHEPHSPISYALKKAVKWSDMPLPELLNELIPDSSTRSEYFKMTGIPDED